MKATKVNAGLAESNGRLLLGIWRDSLHVTCGLTAYTPGSAPGLTLGNEYGKTLPFLPTHLGSPGKRAVKRMCVYYLSPVLNSQGMKKLRYAIHKSTKIKLERTLPAADLGFFAGGVFGNQSERSERALRWFGLTGE